MEGVTKVRQRVAPRFHVLLGFARRRAQLHRRAWAGGSLGNPGQGFHRFVFGFCVERWVRLEAVALVQKWCGVVGQALGGLVAWCRRGRWRWCGALDGIVVVRVFVWCSLHRGRPLQLPWVSAAVVVR